MVVTGFAREVFKVEVPAPEREITAGLEKLLDEVK